MLFPPSCGPRSLLNHWYYGNILGAPSSPAWWWKEMKRKRHEIDMSGGVLGGRVSVSRRRNDGGACTSWSPWKR
ncbi:hypothetical protein ACI65C_000044 [Semiaphis heraclei]